MQGEGDRGGGRRERETGGERETEGREGDRGGGRERGGREGDRGEGGRQGGEKETGEERERGMNTIKFSAKESATHCSCGIRSAALLLASPIISVCDYVSGPEGGREGGREGRRKEHHFYSTLQLAKPL